MPESYKIVETDFRKHPYPQYYVMLEDVADALDANEWYNTNRPPHIQPGSRFREHVMNMKRLGVGADRGDNLLKEQRQAVRDLSELDLYATVCYMKTIAIDKKDPTILHSLKLPLKPTVHKNNRKPSPSPQNIEIRLELKHLKGVPGAIIILGTHVRSGGPYLINICKGEPTSEASWYNPGGHHNSCSKVVLRNLESANRYYVRMRTDRPDGPGPWSQQVSIVVL